MKKIDGRDENLVATLYVALMCNDLFMAGYAISFIILFTNFYIRTYIMKGKKKAAAVRESGCSETVPKANGISRNGANNWQKKENWTIYNVLIE